METGGLLAMSISQVASRNSMSKGSLCYLHYFFLRFALLYLLFHVQFYTVGPLYVFGNYILYVLGARDF